VSDLGLERSLAEALQDGRTMHDETHLSGGHVLAVNQVPARRDGRLLGSVVTLRDHTELRAIAGELDSVRGFAEALRAQAHEAANRLHSVVTLIELGREQDAVRFATTELALTAELSDRLLNTVREPVLAALLLGKTAQARERGVDMSVSEATQVGPLSLDVRDLVTVLGNLVDNAIDAAAVAPQPRSVEVMLRTDARQLTIQVRDSGPGIELENLQAVFTRGWSTKQATGPHGRGLGLALVRQVVNRHGGTIEVRTDAGAVFEVRLPMSVAEADPVLSSRVAGQ
jgi:two-component system CitB family sensor kinase